MDILGGFTFHPPLTEKEYQFFDCYFKTEHILREEEFSGLYFCSYNKEIYRNTENFEFEDNQTLDHNITEYAPECSYSTNFWHIKNKKLTLNIDKKIVYNSLVNACEQLSMLIAHFFNQNPLAKKLNSQFDFLLPKTMNGKIYIKLDEEASIFTIEIINNVVKICEASYIYDLPIPDETKNKQQQLLLNGFTLIEIEKKYNLNKQFFSQLKKQYKNITMLDIKNNAIIDDMYCKTIIYTPHIEVEKSLQYYELSKKIQNKNIEHKIVKI